MQMNEFERQQIFAQVMRQMKDDTNPIQVRFHGRRFTIVDEMDLDLLVNELEVKDRDKRSYR